jgi:hypothetical protein
VSHGKEPTLLATEHPPVNTPHAWAEPDDSGMLEKLARELYEANRLLAFALVRCELALERDAALRVGLSGPSPAAN